MAEPLRATVKLAPKLKAVAAQILLLDRYETIYGIYNHDHEDPARPWALVAMHEAEDVVSGSQLHERMEQFVEKEVHKWFGISWLEFIEQPTDACIKMLEISARHQAVGDKTATAILSQLGTDK